MEYIFELDGNILLWIQDYIRNGFCTPILTCITSLGNSGAIWLVISIALLFFKKTRKVGIMALIAIAGSYLINNLCLKNLVARTRPYEVIDGLKILVEKQKDLSFPSGHAGVAFSAATVYLIMLPKKYGVPAMMFAVLMGFSRLYVGVHYPTDVIAGTLIGIVIGCVVVNICRLYEKKHIANVFTQNTQE